MTSSYSEIHIDNKRFKLGRCVGRGGEGEVFTIEGDPSFVVKIYTSHDKAARQAKVEAMIRARLADSAPLVAFPLRVARDNHGSFCGFVMRLVEGHKPLHELYAPGPRKNHFPQADYRFLVRTASNISRAIASVHNANCVIGDINHSGMLVSSKAIVALIDADSFQVPDGAKHHLCRVGVPEYTPPELQGKKLDGVLRTPNHDAFGLAVVVFQLLFMGRHPFVGSVRTGDTPPLYENIQHHRYVYTEGRNVGMDQPPGTPAITDFYPGVATLFDQAFLKTSQERRPTAAEWIKQLDALEASLTKCQENPLHYIPRDASDCAWCEMENEVGTVLFLPFLGAGRETGIDPGAAAFNLRLTWLAIEAVAVPATESIKPLISTKDCEPSAAAVAAVPKKSGRNPYWIILAVIGGAAFFALPAYWILWVPLIILAVAKSGEDEPRPVRGEPFINVYLSAEAQWASEIQNWRQRCGLTAAQQLKRELTAARDAYDSLSSEEQALIAKYRVERRERQLDAFLDRVDIQSAYLDRIGRTRKATLASFGIVTASDVTESRLRNVPGFGAIRSGVLLAWRASVEGRFVYSAAENDDDRREIALIRARQEAKAAPLRQKLSSGASNLRAALRPLDDNRKRQDPILNKIQELRDQARSDLNFLGIPLPVVPAASASSVRSTAFSNPTPTPLRPTPSQSGSTYAAKNLCPRCGGSMVLRRARRGRHSGRNFWGCSRYPRCKGTRNA